ncbi:MAG: transposase [Deltaproteobacteria bacterium]|nr:transposase [Deltaproteobacteria bacterium]
MAYGREQEDYGDVRLIGIDEISRKKGHVYHTQVYDLERKRLIYTGAHQDKDSLRRFFDWRNLSTTFGHSLAEITVASFCSPLPAQED